MSKNKNKRTANKKNNSSGNQSNNNNNGQKTKGNTMSKTIDTSAAIAAAKSARMSNKEDRKAIKELNGQLKDITLAIKKECKGLDSDAERADIAAQFQSDISAVNHKLEALSKKDEIFTEENIQAGMMVAGDAIGAVLAKPVKGAIGFFGALKDRAGIPSKSK